MYCILIAEILYHSPSFYFQNHYNNTSENVVHFWSINVLGSTLLCGWRFELCYKHYYICSSRKYFFKIFQYFWRKILTKCFLITYKWVKWRNYCIDIVTTINHLHRSDTIYPSQIVSPSVKCNRARLTCRQTEVVHWRSLYFRSLENNWLCKCINETGNIRQLCVRTVRHQIVSIVF